MPEASDFSDEERELGGNGAAWHAAASVLMELRGMVVNL